VTHFRCWNSDVTWRGRPIPIKASCALSVPRGSRWTRQWPMTNRASERDVAMSHETPEKRLQESVDSQAHVSTDSCRPTKSHETPEKRLQESVDSQAHVSTEYCRPTKHCQHCHRPTLLTSHRLAGAVGLFPSHRLAVAVVNQTAIRYRYRYRHAGAGCPRGRSAFFRVCSVLQGQLPHAPGFSRPYHLRETLSALQIVQEAYAP
jgi:hypothetical protein